MKIRFLIGAFSLIALSSYGQEMHLTLSGQYASNAPVTSWSAPSDSFALSWNTVPIVNKFVTTPEFKVTDLTYSLNGKVVEYNPVGTGETGETNNSDPTITPRVTNLEVFGDSGFNLESRLTSSPFNLSSGNIGFNAGTYQATDTFLEGYANPAPLTTVHGAVLTVGAVPEPSTWSLMIVGALALLGIQRFRKTHQTQS